METNSITNAKTINEIIAETGAKSTRNTSELGKDEFLNLLTTQLRYQDPLKPIEDKEFISQMAQFSSLEQMQNMSKAFTDTKAFAMIGKEIIATLKEDGSFTNNNVTGLVSSVKLSGEGAILIVDGKEVPVDRVSNVFEAEEKDDNKSLMDFAGFIGLKTMGEIFDEASGESVLLTGTINGISEENDGISAFIDDVYINAASFADTNNFTSLEELELYLENNLGKTVTVNTYNVNGTLVPVKGFLKEYEITEEQAVIVKLSGVEMNVDDLTGIGKQ
jgi:flagellar basal-body rod modification protein FlgD